MNEQTQITIEQAQQWTNALRSGKYLQGRSRLQFDNRFCCLGVACKIFAPNYERKYGELAGAFPTTDRGAPFWLARISNDLYQKIGQSFVELNDNLDYSFDEIADIIELVYVHKALD